MIEEILFSILIATLLILLIGGMLYGIKKGWSQYRRLRVEMQRDWRWVPPPIWAAKRGGRDYW